MDLELFKESVNTIKFITIKQINLTIIYSCFYIEEERITKNYVKGHLKVSDDFEYRIDYEEYEIIYLTVRVNDTEQKFNEGSADATLTIRIEDINDCEPEFIENTVFVTRNVVEEALEETLVGTISAFDRDGPEFNKIVYSIKWVTKFVKFAITNKYK